MSEEKEGQGRRCPSCGHQPLVARKVRDEFEYGPDGERVTVVAEGVPVLVCPACGETLYGPEAAAVRHQAICHALGLLSPAEIKALRERLGPDQEGFARLTGIGVATLSRWERGRLLQTRALDRYLRLLAAVPQAAGFLRTLQEPPRTPAALAPSGDELPGRGVLGGRRRGAG
jgi:HTH-type transcriptional regulator/antitoxin MqsA